MLSLVCVTISELDMLRHLRTTHTNALTRPLNFQGLMKTSVSGAQEVKLGDIVVAKRKFGQPASNITTQGAL